MSDAKVTFNRSGHQPTQAEIDELDNLVETVLHLPAFADKHAAVVLNALLSAYWRAAVISGRQAIAADGMVQIGASYLAGLALAGGTLEPHDAAIPGAANGHQVH